MTKLLGFIILVLIGIPVALLSGVVLADFWRWFVLPIFTVPPITYLQAIGLMYVAGLFKLGLATIEVEGQKEKPLLVGIGKSVAYVVALLILWGVGALWSLFI